MHKNEWTGKTGHSLQVDDAEARSPDVESLDSGSFLLPENSSSSKKDLENVLINYKYSVNDESSLDRSNEQ